MVDLRPMSLYANGVKIVDQRRMRLRGRTTMNLRPDMWELTLFMLTDEEKASVQSATMLSVEGEEQSTLCSGKIDEVFTHLDNGKDLTTVIITDGMDFYTSSVSLSLSAGVSLQQTVRTLASRCSSPVPVTVACSRDMPLYRGQAFHGKTVEYIDPLAKSLAARAYYSRGGLYVISRGMDSDPIIFRDGDLKQGLFVANGAYVVEPVQMKGYAIGRLVAVPDYTATKFRLLAQTVEADNYDGPWKTELIMIDEKQMMTNEDWGGG